MTLTGLRSAPHRALLQHHDPGTTAGHPGVLEASTMSHPAGSQLRGWLSGRCHWLQRLSRAGTRAKFQCQPFCRKPPEGSWKRAHGECSIVEHSPRPATAPQGLKSQPRAHTALQGLGAAPATPRGSSLPTARCQGPDSTHCSQGSR